MDGQPIVLPRSFQTRPFHRTRMGLHQVRCQLSDAAVAFGPAKARPDTAPLRAIAPDMDQGTMGIALGRLTKPFALWGQRTQLCRR